jgi:hypothetical protein
MESGTSFHSEEANTCFHWGKKQQPGPDAVHDVLAERQPAGNGEALERRSGGLEIEDAGGDVLTVDLLAVRYWAGGQLERRLA